METFVPKEMPNKEMYGEGPKRDILVEFVMEPTIDASVKGSTKPGGRIEAVDPNLSFCRFHSRDSFEKEEIRLQLLSNFSKYG